MDKKEFKKVLVKVLTEYGFETKGKISRVETDDLIIVVATQKSNYDNSYYINYGFLIKSLNPNITNPKDNQCDVFGRFILDILGKSNNNIYYESINSDEFCQALKRCLDDKIKPVLEFGLKKYFELNPIAINTATLNAKKYLSEQK